MAQSPPEADIFLERDSSRVRGILDLVPTADPATTTINLDPQVAGITLHRTAPEQEPALELNTTDGTSVATLTHQLSSTQDRGLLHLGSENGPGAVRIESTELSGRIRVVEDDATRAKIGTHRGVEQAIGGLMSVHKPSEALGVVFRAQRARDPDRVGGLVEAYSDGVATGRLIGEDAALELLSTQPGGGGVGVIGAAPSQSGGDPDVFVDLNDAMSGTTPRMDFDGEAGAVTLGRNALGPNRPGVRGRIKLRFGTGSQSNTYLEAGSHQPSTDDRGGELILRRRVSGGVVTSGWFRANSGGLKVGSGTSGSPPGPAASFSTSGELRLAGTLNQGSLATEDPAFVTPLMEVEQGGTVEIEMTVGDASGLTFKFGDPNVRYELTTSLSGYTDARLWVAVDTSAAGTSTSTARVVAGDASLSITSETSGITPPLDTGQYPIRVKESGASTWADLGEVSIVQP